jgi:hypothetical protein
VIDNRKVTLGTAIWMFVAGVIVAMVFSKFSALAAYHLGYATATRNMDQEQEIRLAHFQEHRMESCLAWWFNDSFKNLKAAQFYMCQNRRRWE